MMALVGAFHSVREVGIEFSPMWRGCEGDPYHAVTRSSIGHLVEDEFFVWQERVWPLDREHSERRWLIHFSVDLNTTALERLNCLSERPKH